MLMPTLTAAKMPALFAMSKGCFGGAVLAAASACPVAVELASLDEALEMAASLAATSFCNCPPTRLAKRM